MKRLLATLAAGALLLGTVGPALADESVSVDTMLSCDGTWAVIIHFTDFADGHRILLTVNGYVYPEIVPTTDSQPVSGTATAKGKDAINLVGVVSTPDGDQSDVPFSHDPVAPCATKPPAPRPTPTPAPTHRPAPRVTPPPTSTQP